MDRKQPNTLADTIRTLGAAHAEVIRRHDIIAARRLPSWDGDDLVVVVEEFGTVSKNHQVREHLNWLATVGRKAGVKIRLGDPAAPPWQTITAGLMALRDVFMESLRLRDGRVTYTQGTHHYATMRDLEAAAGDVPQWAWRP